MSIFTPHQPKLKAEPAPEVLRVPGSALHTTMRPSAHSGPSIRSSSFPVIDGQIAIPKVRMMMERFVVFMSELVDDTGEPLIVDDHHVMWANAMQDEPKLVLMAPRDHGKTWTSLAYLMWRAWRHNRDPLTGQWNAANEGGAFQGILFSVTAGMAGNFFDRLQQLILANEHLFVDILPMASGGPRIAIKAAWKNGFIRLRNMATLTIKAWGTSSRGLHPQLIICDDVQDEGNSSTKYQRDKTWRWFVSVILPMLGPDGQIAMIGTAQHYNDLLHRIRPSVKNDTGFRWLKFRAVDWDSGAVLWPARHDFDNLRAMQRLDTVLFSREYQNDPRDDASSMFPHHLLQKALDPGTQLTFVPGHVAQGSKGQGVFHLLSADMALSESVGADFCVINIARFELATQKRQLLFAVRERGWGFATQVQMLRDLTREYDVDLGCIENNSFQKWVAAEVAKYPETATKIVGHTTGIEKSRMQDGVPSLIIGLDQGLWTLPNGGDSTLDPMAASAQEYARIWKSEMNAFGWVNDKLQGAGEHDDTVMAFWLLDRAARMINTILQQGPKEQYVSMKDVGLERVKIGDDW